ncbi:collagen alpha-5(VI) chain-like [Gigantopelta aegis]|uniref:collagen alpha-5(VI) chain-like n=1 Tax=Gigantopelta aegis TaxID=1735272 RepID=UPI001B88960D|nr:collagen alpha-5(VI) chain-like [Gigantopelta aegis]
MLLVSWEQLSVAIMQEKVTLKLLALFMLFQICQMKEHCQLDEVKKDIFFLLDSSGSVGYRNFQTAKAFIAGFVSRLPIGVSNTHVAIIRFSSAPKRYASLNSYYTKQNLISAVANIRYTGGSTNTAEALEFLRTKLMRSSRGDRKDAENIIIIITDGSSTSLPSKLTREVSTLHEMGVVIAAIGVGSMVKKTELDFMASEDRLSFTVENYKALFAIQSSLFGVTCDKTSNNVSDLEDGQSTKQYTTDPVWLDTSTEIQTASTRLLLLSKTTQHLTNKPVSSQTDSSSKVRLQSWQSFITGASYVTKNQQTSGLTSSKPNTVETTALGKRMETISRVLTTVEPEKHTLKDNSTIPFSPTSNHNNQRTLAVANTKSATKRPTVMSGTSTHQYEHDRFVTGTEQSDLTTLNFKEQFSIITTTENDRSELLTEMRRLDSTTEIRIPTSTQITTFADSSGRHKDPDDTSLRKGGHYLDSKSKHGLSTKMQRSLNIIFYTTAIFVGLVLISIVIIIATRKQRLKSRRKKPGLETV